jgi:phosphoenolpyruvate carboxykinase (GTP)
VCPPPEADGAPGGAAAARRPPAPPARGGGPPADAIDISGLDLTDADMAELLTVDNELWRQELSQIEEHYDHIGASVPSELQAQLTALEKRLSS